MVKRRGSQFSSDSIVYGPYKMTISVISAISLLFALIWGVVKYVQYTQTLENIRSEYLHANQTRLVDEHRNIVEFIEYKREQTLQMIKEELERQVQTAYVTAAHLYSRYRHEKDQNELRGMVIETLRPIRWSTGSGYYFAFRTRSGFVDLLADRPQFEQKTLLDVQGGTGKFIFQDMKSIVETRGAGFYQYEWYKPAQLGTSHPKLSFVRYFKPFDWCLGAGFYIDDIDERIQGDVLERLRQISFGKMGDVLIFLDNATTICDTDPHREGRRVDSIYWNRTYPLGAQLFEISRSKELNGYVMSGEITADDKSEESIPLLAQVKKYQPWGWNIVTMISMTDMKSAITAETEKQKTQIKNEIIVFFLVLMTLFSLLFFVARLNSRRTKAGVEAFTDFFVKASESNARLQDQEIAFSEFRTIADFANKMLETRVANEEELQRNRLRLDTLLQIARETSQSEQEIYTFVISRLLDITASSTGYIGFVDSDQKRFSMVIRANSKRIEGREANEILYETTIHLSDYSRLEQIISGTETIIENDLKAEEKSSRYPFMKSVTRTMELPIMHENRVVILAGVGSREKPYSETEQSAIRLLLEGMYKALLVKRADREMASLKNILNSIIDSMPSKLIGIDKSYNVIFCNRIAEQELELPREAAIGAKADQILPQFNLYSAMIDQTLTTGNPTEEKRIRRKDLQLVRFESIMVFPFPTESGLGAALKIDDITEKVRLEDMMVQSEKMLSVGGLAAGMAHEINNPLAGIIQNLQVVRNRLKADLKKNKEVAAQCKLDFENLADYLDKREINTMFESIHDSANRAATLVKNMLSFSRKSDAVSTTQNPIELLESTIDLAANDYDLKKQFDFKKIQVNRYFDPSTPPIICETTNIQQVLLNIIKNGAHALMDKEYSGDDKPSLQLSIYPENGMACIEIADNGPGMDQETQKRIFEPFFTTKPVGLGTGLGLSISYFIIVDQHRGDLSVSSELGVGSKFTIRLPPDRRSARR